MVTENSYYVLSPEGTKKKVPPAHGLYFLGPNFFLPVFRGSEIFSGGIFVGSVFFLMANFVIQRF